MIKNNSLNQLSFKKVVMIKVYESTDKNIRGGEGEIPHSAKAPRGAANSRRRERDSNPRGA